MELPPETQSDALNRLTAEFNELIEKEAPDEELQAKTEEILQHLPEQVTQLSLIEGLEAERESSLPTEDQESWGSTETLTYSLELFNQELSGEITQEKLG